MAFPALNHAALTVRDLDVSGPWYRQLIGADPVLDEHTDAGFRHLVWAFDNGTLFGIHQHDREFEGGQFTEFRAGLDHVALRLRQSRRAGGMGRTGSMRSGSSTAELWTPHTGRA